MDPGPPLRLKILATVGGKGFLDVGREKLKIARACGANFAYCRSVRPSQAEFLEDLGVSFVSKTRLRMHSREGYSV